MALIESLSGSSKDLNLELSPDLMFIDDLGILKNSERNSMRILFAFPSTGGAATRIWYIPSSPFFIVLDFAEGFTLIRRITYDRRVFCEYIDRVWYVKKPI
jgi:hypothetical protein